MLSGFTNERVDFDVKYLDVPQSMSRPKVTGTTLNIYRIRFNNVFKNEKTMFLTISVLLSLFLVLTTYTINYIYHTFSADEDMDVKTAELASSSYAPATVISDDVMDSDNVLALATQGGNASNPQKIFSSNNSGFSSNGGSSNATTYAGDRKKEQVNTGLIASTNTNTNTKRVLLTVDDSVNTNPFVPYSTPAPKKTIVGLPNPPSDFYANSDANTIMKTVISGILYDQYNPSAILNIGGSDYLVKKGDIINKFKVLAISRNTVTVQLGSNVYRAGVGEIIADGSVNYNTVSNLNRKFGGSKGVD